MEYEDLLKPVRAFSLPTKEELEEEGLGRNLYGNIIQTRMREIIRVLSNYRSLSEKGVSRNAYVDQLKLDLWTCYGYNDFLAGMLVEMFPGMEPELLDVVEAFERPRPIFVRTNPLKTLERNLVDFLLDRGVSVGAKLPELGLIVVRDSQQPINATPEYKDGMAITRCKGESLSCL